MVRPGKLRSADGLGIARGCDPPLGVRELLVRLTHTPLFESPVARVLDLTCELDRDTRPYVMAVATKRITFVRSGLFARVVDAESFVADAGQILCFDAREYGFSYPRLCGNRCTIIEPSSETRLELDDRLGFAGEDQFARAQVAAPRAWIERHYQLLSALVEAHRDADICVEELSLELIRGVFRAASLIDQGGHGCLTSAAERQRRQLASDARVLLNGSLAKPPSLSNLARDVECSAFHLSRVFAQVHGMTIREYLARQRALAAAERMLGGEQNLSALALALGLYDHAHLCRVFRRVWGMSPTRFRERYGTRDRFFRARVRSGIRRARLST